MSARLVVLDADGVLFSERPYAEVALLVALRACGLEPRDGEDFASAAIESAGLHRALKERGGNSNWDLANALVVALRDEEAHGEVRLRLARGEDEAAAARWLAAVRALPGDPRASDPLRRFGIEREREVHVAIARACQQDFEALAPAARWRAATSRSELRAVCAALGDAGRELRVCTGRPRAELEVPLEYFGLRERFALEASCTADEVERAESAMQRSGLGKPHAFPVLCALLGFERALEALRTGRAPHAGAIDSAGAVYVGDAASDLEAVRAARIFGLELAYLHVASPASDERALERLAREPDVTAVLAGIAELPGVLAEMPA